MWEKKKKIKWIDFIFRMLTKRCQFAFDKGHKVNFFFYLAVLQPVILQLFFKIFFGCDSRYDLHFIMLFKIHFSISPLKRGMTMNKQIKGYYYCCFCCFSLGIFHTSVNRWSFTGVWVTTNLRSPGLVSLFWPFSTMLEFRWSEFFLWFPILPVPIPSLWGTFQLQQVQLMSPLLSCLTAFFFGKVWAFFYLFTYFYFPAFAICGGP